MSSGSQSDSEAPVAADPDLPAVPVTEIGREKGSLAGEFRQLWEYRDLLVLLTRRDLSVRYKQSAIGVWWAIVQPLVLMGIFSVVFGRLASLPSEGVPYPLFALGGLLPWLFFSRALSGASESLVSSASLVTKVYFPRLVLPISKVVSGLVDLGIAFGLLLAALAWYQVLPGWQILFLPVFVGIATLTALALGLWLAALNVRYRDVGLLVPFLIQVWMYASPIAYSASLVPDRWRWAYDLNPVAGVVQGFRWCLFGTEPPAAMPLILSMAGVLVLLFTGLLNFKRAERDFADVI